MRARPVQQLPLPVLRRLEALLPPPLSPGRQASVTRCAQVTVLAVECQCRSRGALLGDPRHDALAALLLVAWEDGSDASDPGARGCGGGGTRPPRVALRLSSSTTAQKFKQLRPMCLHYWVA